MELNPGMTVRCVRGDLTQIFRCGDLLDADAVPWYREHLPPRVRLVYSDPPWNPGNGKFWRTKAGLDLRSTYDDFLAAWCAVVALCQRRGCTDVLVEQSINAAHANLLRAAIARTEGWTLPERGVWRVLYGTGAKLLPNALLHFGTGTLIADPTDLSGESMTLRAVTGLRPMVAPGDTIVDPCMGLGRTSRIAHYLGCSAVGSELDPKRLARTIGWLAGQGYAIEVRA